MEDLAKWTTGFVFLGRDEVFVDGREFCE